MDIPLRPENGSFNADYLFFRFEFTYSRFFNHIDKVQRTSIKDRDFATRNFNPDIINVVGSKCCQEMFNRLNIVIPFANNCAPWGSLYILGARWQQRPAREICAFENDS